MTELKLFFNGIQYFHVFTVKTTFDAF
jgi:hypothetical protein